MQTHFFVDIHCHSSIKAYARSFETNAGYQSANPEHLSSMWHNDAPGLFDKIKNYASGLVNFIQSDAASLSRGRVCVACLSFYPQENGFFINRTGTGIVSDTLTKLASEFGQARIDFLQQRPSYWQDLKDEMNFLVQRENVAVKLEGREISYQVARSFSEIEIADKEQKLGEKTIFFIPTIEGTHIFDQMIDSTEPASKYPEGIPAERLALTLERVSELRQGNNGLIRPAFITFAHHFWNGLCGHARSLSGLVKIVVNQENGLGLGFMSAGFEVARALLRLEKDEAGRDIPPIVIDIKHMSRRSREDYFKFLETEFGDRNIPIIASHAGVTGLSQPGGERLTAAASEGLFMEEEINFFDDEIVLIEKSRGIIGIQLDERRIGSKQALRSARGHIRRRDILYAWSKLVWNQVRHIAEVLDINGQFAWGIQSLGTDFDGIIDPINGYWTAAEIDELDDYLLKHAFNYLQEVMLACPLNQAVNRMISAEEVVERVMTSNALDFLSRIY